MIRILCGLMLLSIFACDNESTGHSLGGSANLDFKPIGKGDNEPTGHSSGGLASLDFKQISKNIEKIAATKVIDLAGGAAQVYALMEDRTVKCTGINLNNECDLSKARNVQQKIDAANAKFSKVAGGYFFACGILMGDMFDRIPVCWGKEGKWLDVPHEPVKDIACGSGITCFIKIDGRLACVGPDIPIFTKNSETIRYNAQDLPSQHGITATSEREDFSQKQFVDLKVGSGRVCATAADDGRVHCMGSNGYGSGEALAEPVLDYFPGDESSTYYILLGGELKTVGVGLGFRDVPNISDPKGLKYRKIIASKQGFDYLTAHGNFYDDGRPIPENTLVSPLGFSEEGVLSSVCYYNSYEADRFRIITILKTDHTIKNIDTRTLW